MLQQKPKISICQAKRKIEKPKNVIAKAENINLPKIYTKVKEKPQKKIKLKIDKGINKLEIKGKKKAKEEPIVIIKEVKTVEEVEEKKEEPLEIENYEEIIRN